MAKIQGITIKFSADVSNIETNLRKAQSSIRQTQTELKNVNRALKFDSGNTDLLAQKQTILQNAVSQTKDKLNALKDAEKELKASMVDGGTEEQQAQLRSLEREIAQTENQLKNYKNQLAVANPNLQAFGVACQQAGEKLQSVGKNLSVVSAGLVALGTASISAFNDVDSGVNKVINATGATGKSAESIKGVYKDLADEVGGSFEDIGDTVGAVSTRFGSTGKELKNLSSEFQKFSQITGQNGASAVQSITQAMRLFNVDTSQAVNVMGLLAKTSQDTGMTVESLESTLNQSGVTLQEMGLSLQDSVTLLANFDKEGVNGSEMIAKMSKAATYFTSQGKDMSTGLRDLTERLQNTTTHSQAVEEAFSIFGKRSGNTFIKLAEQGKVSFDNLATDLSKYSNVVDKTYKSSETGSTKMQNAVKGVKTALSGLGSVVSSSVVSILQGFSEKVKALGEGFNKLSPSAQKTVVSIAAVVAAVGPALVIFGKLASTIGSSISTIISLGLKISSLTTLISPMSLAIAGAVAVITAMTVAFSKMPSQTSIVDRHLQEISKNIETNSQKWKELKQAQEESSSSAVGTAQSQQMLLTQLQSCVDENGRVIESEKERAKVLAGELSQSLGTQIDLQGNIISINGKEIQSNKDLSNSIQEVIRQKEAESLLDANKKAYQEAIKNKAQYERDYASAVKQANDAQKQYNENLKNHVYTTRDGIEVRRADEAELERFKEKISTSKDTLDSANRSINEHNNLLSAMSSGGSVLASTLDTMTSSITAWSGTNKKQVSEATQSIQMDLNTVSEAYKNGLDGVTKKTVDTYANMYAEQLNQLSLSGQLTSDYAGKISKSTIDALNQADAAGKLSESGKAGLQAYKQAMSTGLDETKITMTSKGSELGTTAKNINTDIEKKLNEHSKGNSKKWGGDLIDGMKQGIDSKQGNLFQSIINVAEGIKARLHFSRPDIGPLREYEKWMPDFMQGLAKGIEKNKRLVISQVQDVATNVDGLLNPNMQVQATLDQKDNQATLQSQLGELLNAIKTDNNYTFNLSTQIDGREIAKSTAIYTQEEITEMTRLSNLRRGIR